MSSGSMPSGLRGKRVLLAGASRGIGENMAKGLAKEGCQLVLASRSGEPLGFFFLFLFSTAGHLLLLSRCIYNRRTPAGRFPNHCVRVMGRSV